jgi:hypothetical protein
LPLELAKIWNDELKPVKPPIIPAADSTKKGDEREYLSSWKEIARYMRCGVRTVQRYERESGLPVRRPTGKSRGSVIATRGEIDAWIAAAPIRETFRLTRIERDSRTRSQTDRIESGVIAMRKLKDQMQALRLETRSALNLLIDRVSAVHLLLPPSRPSGYEPLVNMYADMDMDIDAEVDKNLHLYGGKGSPTLNFAPADRHKSSRRRRNKTSLLNGPKPH